MSHNELYWLLISLYVLASVLFHGYLAYLRYLYRSDD